MMRNLAPLLLIAIFAACVFMVFSSGTNADPADEARKFLRLLQRDDYEAAVAEFGDNTCHCAPKGGYVAYLRYDKAHDPNVAFLRGQQFEIGQPTTKQLPYNGEKHLFPWDKPEDVAVYVPITFKDPNSRPYFLPADMAFGYEMPQNDLEKFDSNPADGWMRAFTLRLRPKLEAGVVKPPDPNDKPEVEGELKGVDKSLIPPEVLKYQQPKDAAPVKLTDGRTVPASEMAAQLPRLKAITIGFKIVRRGTYHRWAVKKLGIENPVLDVHGHELALHE
jgi:hypothetical protein